ncbi:MAG: magnesium transporter [Planctomycetaceae bacterium]|nr:MAG: magnesium transporter [Planctomycetaceae bacterium]
MVTANPILIPELRLLLTESDTAGLREVAQELHPATVAEFSEGLDDQEIWQLLDAVSVERQAEIFPYYSMTRQVELVQSADRVRLGALLEWMAADNRDDLLRELDSDMVDEILPLVAKAERHDIRMLLSCPEDSAGTLMTTEYASLPADITAGEAVTRLRSQAPNSESIYYIYVLDSDRTLVGFVSLRDLIMAKPTALVSELMQRDPISVRVDEQREYVVQKLARFDFIAIPVVDDRNRLVGIVTHDDVLDAVRQDATDDAQRIAAIAPLGESYLEAAILSMTWKRGVWLTILFATAAVTAMVLARSPIQHVWLVAFIPLIIASGGNSGNQSATLVITALSTGDCRLADWPRILKRECVLGLLLGTLLAVPGYCLALVYAPNPAAATVIPLTILGVVMMGTMVGSVLPLLFRSVGLDPALMSNPFVSAIVDVVGIVLYMLIAILLLG